MLPEQKKSSRSSDALQKNLSVLYFTIITFAFLSMVFSEVCAEEMASLKEKNRNDSVRYLVFSPDSKLLASDYCLWNLNLNKIINKEAVYVYRFSEKGKYFADLFGWVYKTEGLQRRTGGFKDYKTGGGGAFSPDGKIYAYITPSDRNSEHPAMPVCIRHDLTTDIGSFGLTGQGKLNIIDLENFRMIESEYLQKISYNFPITASLKKPIKGAWLLVSYSNTPVLGYDDVIDWKRLTALLKNPTSTKQKKIIEIINNNSGTGKILNLSELNTEPDRASKTLILNSINSAIINRDLKPAILSDSDALKIEAEIEQDYFLIEKSEIIPYSNRMIIESCFPDCMEKTSNTIINLYGTKPLNCVKTYKIPDCRRLKNIYTTKQGVYIAGYFSNDIIFLNPKTGEQKKIRLPESSMGFTVSDSGKLIAYFQDITPVKACIFDLNQVANWEHIINYLKNSKKNSTGNVVFNMLPKQVREQLKIKTSKTPDIQTKKSIIQALNNALNHSDIIDKKAYLKFNNSMEIKSIKNNPLFCPLNGNSLKRINRLLIEDAFPHAMLRKKVQPVYVLKVCDAQTLKQVFKVCGDADFARIRVVAISPDDQMLAAGKLGIEKKSGGINLYLLKTKSRFRQLHVDVNTINKLIKERNLQIDRERKTE